MLQKIYSAGYNSSEHCVPMFCKLYAKYNTHRMQPRNSVPDLQTIFGESTEQEHVRFAIPGPHISLAPVQGQRPISIFDRHVKGLDPALLVDDILPPGVLLEFASPDVLNGYINYVELFSVITERDPEEDERYISISNRFYTHFHEFGTVIHVVARSATYWWYFCYDIDASDCAIGRIKLERITGDEIVEWVRKKRLSGHYPVQEISIADLKGWRSFQ